MPETDNNEGVWCDNCLTDWTDRKETGGFLCGDKAICPDCSKEVLDKYHILVSMQTIKRCPDKCSFSEWIRDLRSNEQCTYCGNTTNLRWQYGRYVCADCLRDTAD